MKVSMKNNIKDKKKLLMQEPHGLYPTYTHGANAVYHRYAERVSICGRGGGGVCVCVCVCVCVI